MQYETEKFSDKKEDAAAEHTKLPTMKNGHKKAGNTRGFRSILTGFLLLTGMILAAAGYLPVYLQNRRADTEKERFLDISLEQDETGEPENGRETEGGSDQEKEKRKNTQQDPLQRRFDFAGLKEINREIVGWIYVPGTQIDYPVCRGADDSYYLTHSAEKEESVLGAVFVPPETGETLGEAHVLFYGHNMRSGRMFGELSSYCEKTFREKYPEVYVYTLGFSCRSVVYSVYRTDHDGPAYTIGYSFETEAYRRWQEETAEQSLYDCGYMPDSGQQVFTLSTCTDSGAATDRLVVHCAVTERRDT